MPFDRVVNRYWGTVTDPPEPPTTGLTLRVPNPQGADFAELPLPFSAVVSFPGNAPLDGTPDTAESLRVMQIVGNVLTLERVVPEPIRRAIRAGDEISASLVHYGPEP